MGIYDRDYYREPLEVANPWKRLTTWLIISNVVIYILSLVIARWFKYDLRYDFGLVPSSLIDKLYAWQLVTYSFLHDYQQIWHILFNMLFLYFFGRDLEEIYGKLKFSFLYFGGAIFAGLLYSLVEYFSNRDAICIGASGALFAIAVVCALHWPNRIVIFIIFPIKLKHLVLLFIAVDIISLLVLPQTATVAYVAHLAGAAFGLLFFKFYDYLFDLFYKISEKQVKSQKKKEEEFEKKIDAILEKVSREGMASLNKKEKQLLLEASKRKKEFSK